MDFKGESVEIAAIEFVTAGQEATVFDPKDVKVKFSLSKPDEKTDEKLRRYEEKQNLKQWQDFEKIVKAKEGDKKRQQFLTAQTKVKKLRIEFHAKADLKLIELKQIKLYRPKSDQ